MQKKLFNRYEYNPQKDLLGKGAFAKVFKAYDQERNRYVALKFYQGDANEKYDIIGEINRMEDIRHLNLVKYYDARSISHIGADGTETKQQVGIMEYANGGNLADWTNQLRQQTAHLHSTTQRHQHIAAAIQPLTKGILNGLAFLHQHGILHRDIKPANILLHQEREQLIPKIADFGLSKETGSHAASSQGLKGTIEYMAPEQLYPRKYAKEEGIKANADLWAFGIILYELFAQQIPVGRRSEGSTVEDIMENLDLFEPNRLVLQDIPMPYQRMIEVCLVKFSEKRVQTAEKLLTIIEEVPTYDSINIPQKETLIEDTIVDLPIPNTKSKSKIKYKKKVRSKLQSKTNNRECF